MDNTILRKAFKDKQNEFWTTAETVENGLRPFADQFAGKSIYCNCDCEWSEFVKWFQRNGKEIGIKKLVYTGIDRDGKGVDYRSDQAIALMKEADVIVTNPPFTLFRDFINRLFNYGKKFIILGNVNAVTYANVTPRILDNEMFVWESKPKRFMIPDDYRGMQSCKQKENGFRTVHISTVRWFSNLRYPFKIPKFEFEREYRDGDYEKLDNFDAILCERYKDIPRNYAGLIAVPISFLDKMNREQFRLVGHTDMSDSNRTKIYKDTMAIRGNKIVHNDSTPNHRAMVKISGPSDGGYYICDGEYYKAIYPKILIRNREFE